MIKEEGKEKGKKIGERNSKTKILEGKPLIGKKEEKRGIREIGGEGEREVGKIERERRRLVAAGLVLLFLQC